MGAVLGCCVVDGVVEWLSVMDMPTLAKIRPCAPPHRLQCLLCGSVMKRCLRCCHWRFLGQAVLMVVSGQSDVEPQGRRKKRKEREEKKEKKRKRRKKREENQKKRWKRGATAKRRHGESNTARASSPSSYQKLRRRQTLALEQGLVQNESASHAPARPSGIRGRRWPLSPSARGSLDHVRYVWHLR